MCSGGIKWSYGDEGPTDCDCSGGVIYLRPKGHAFEWPGGPACGWWSEKEYESATPVMPLDWHVWTETDDQVYEMKLTSMGDLDPSNIVHCSCGFVGTIAEEEIHVQEQQAAFIAEHRAPIA